MNEIKLVKCGIHYQSISKNVNGKFIGKWTKISKCKIYRWTNESGVLFIFMHA